MEVKSKAAGSGSEVPRLGPTQDVRQEPERLDGLALYVALVPGPGVRGTNHVVEQSFRGTPGLHKDSRSMLPGVSQDAGPVVAGTLGLFAARPWARSELVKVTREV